MGPCAVDPRVKIRLYPISGLESSNKTCSASLTLVAARIDEFFLKNDKGCSYRADATLL